MVLWASMLSSHFSPQKLSTVTLRTVPVSRQCGATPIQTATTKKDGLMRNVNSYIMSCHWICGGWGDMTIIIYSNNMAQWVSGMFSFEDDTCLFEERTWHMSRAWSEQTYRIRQGWSVECRNFEPHRFYRRCVWQRECWTCMLSDYLTPGKEMKNRFFKYVNKYFFVQMTFTTLSSLPVRVWIDFLEQWNDGFVSLCKCYN